MFLSTHFCMELNKIHWFCINIFTIILVSFIVLVFMNPAKKCYFLCKDGLV